MMLLDENDVKSTKLIYEKERLLDITMLRNVFVGGDITLRKLRTDMKAELEVSSKLMGLDGVDVSEPSRRHSAEDIGNATTSPKSSEQIDLECIEQIDIYGSAFLLLLYMSESKWEHITSIAKQSAKDAGLILDVNKLILEDEALKSLRKVPPPPHTSSSIEATNEQQEQQQQPNGISFTSLCYIISISLRGSRLQKLTLLFYILLPPKILNDILTNFPGGGLPNWLFEINGDSDNGQGDTDTVILSYDSLSYYYNYDGVLLPKTSQSTSDDEYESKLRKKLASSSSSSFTKKKSLCIDAKSAVEILATLVAESVDTQQQQGEEQSEEKKNAPYGTRKLMISLLEKMDGANTTSNEEGTDQVSSSSANCQEVSAMLHQQQQQQQQQPLQDSSTISVNLSIHEQNQISKFAELASALTTNGDDDNKNNVRLRWSMKDFIKWANMAINETILDNIMYRLFGIGLLPNSIMECTLVKQRWVDWNLSSRLLKYGDEEEEEDFVTPRSSEDDGHIGQNKGGLRNLFNTSHEPSSNDAAATGHQATTTPDVGEFNRVFGGIGGVDGKGGLGYGVLYCIDKKWWDDWVEYTGWKIGSASASISHSPQKPRSLKRPRELSTESLIDRSTNSPCVSGSRGSYEVMKHQLIYGKDYVLVPPGVWNVLYEIYGGGPPLPRMVLPPRGMLPPRGNDGHQDSQISMNGGGQDESVEVLRKPSKMIQQQQQYPHAVPASVRVAIHPWLLHCQICDPQQPYRRGDTGPMSIRIMSMPNQPLWRLLGEIVIRLPISHSKARDSQGEGWARLWRFEVPANGKATGGSRYGPWVLLCKNRAASIPLSGTTSLHNENYGDRWETTYTDKHSVESIGLSDGMRLMLEFAIINKDGSLTWPREAAAKATAARRVAEEDAIFRLLLRGLDAEGTPLKEPIMRKTVDAMDSTGRWYQARIVNVDNTTNGGSSHSVASSDNNTPAGFRENTHVRVHFNDHTDNHEEWIGVKSDCLAVLGRMTSGSTRNLDTEHDDDATAASSDTKSEHSKTSRIAAGINKKKDTSDTSSVADPSTVCLFPGYGACGLINLGNTCYANSGWQCMSYLPLLRAYLLSGQFKINGDMNRDNPLGTGGKILEEFSELLRYMWSGKYGARAPQKFRSVLAKCRSQYCGADQQDAQELLNDMLDMLHEDGNRVIKKPYVEALEDKFIEKTELPRVGQEAWRRFLRRNRSAISDLSMGQVYNKVTCPVCNHSSKNFDPFNMLSLPFPTVAEVIFQCTVVRRATAMNCPNTLSSVGRPRHSSQKDKTKSSSSSNNDSPSPPSKQLIFEEYLIPMSRLADIGDLKMKLQNLSGIPTKDLRVCKREDIATNAGDSRNSYTKMYTKIAALPDKEGPCVKLLQQESLDEISSPMVARIIAFETTLRVRPTPVLSSSVKSLASLPSSKGGTTDDETTASEFSIDESNRVALQNKREDRVAQDLLKVYGDDKECIIFDTNPTPMAKVISRSLWPKSTKDFTLGLRVDAIDHRGHWFPGSVIEIVDRPDESKPEDVGEDSDIERPVAKVMIHFDNFSAKWDEEYPLESFTEGRVCPLYSHATPRPKPTEFVLHHRGSDSKTGKCYLFGQSVFIQCYNEWSTARAGAHILAQASRFLEVSHFKTSAGISSVDLKIQEKERQEARKIIARVIDALIRSDRKYVEQALESAADGTSFDVSNMSQTLSRKLNEVLSLLPFDVRVTTANSPLGTNDEEMSFPFSLVRTIGNYMNARHSLVLHWREKPDNSNDSNRSLSDGSNTRHSDSDGPPHFLYSPPLLAQHPQSRGLLKEDQKDPTSDNHALKRHPSSSHGGMHIGVCLTEFCKEQQLDATGCWRCPQCKVDREGKQSMTLWNLPDLLTFHLKRFNASSRWREKISTRVDFPLTGLNMREWCNNESPLCQEPDDEAFVYDLVGVVNHYGGMTGGHYVATCKATACSPDGEEDVAYNFNGIGVTTGLDTVGEEATQSSGWRLVRSKEKESSANAAAKAVAESSEPLWLQFDDDLVEPVPPRNVVSETAYVLFYRRRRMHSANVARYTSFS